MNEKIQSAKSPKQAVDKALELARMGQKKNFLFLTAVHGDEAIGVKAMKQLEKETPQDNFSWLIANEKAYKKGQRFIDADMNRISPGDKYSSEYEKRRASELISIGRNYRYIIDIHGTATKPGIFSIVTNATVENLALARRLSLKNIVIWPSGFNTRTGPLTKFFDCAVEIECGQKNSPQVLRELVRFLKKIINQDGEEKNVYQQKNYYEVYGKVRDGEISKKRIKKLREFKQILVNKEKFFPLLINRYENIVCYKMRRIKYFY